MLGGIRGGKREGEPRPRGEGGARAPRLIEAPPGLLTRFPNLARRMTSLLFMVPAARVPAREWLAATSQVAARESPVPRCCRSGPAQISCPRDYRHVKVAVGCPSGAPEGRGVRGVPRRSRRTAWPDQLDSTARRARGGAGRVGPPRGQGSELPRRKCPFDQSEASEYPPSPGARGRAARVPSPAPSPLLTPGAPGAPHPCT